MPVMPPEDRLTHLEKQVLRTLAKLGRCRPGELMEVLKRDDPGASEHDILMAIGELVVRGTVHVHVGPGQMHGNRQIFQASYLELPREDEEKFHFAS